MKALISPIEIREEGYRVAEIHETGFPVAEPLFWIDCDNTIIADQFWYNPSDSTFKTMPEPTLSNNFLKGNGIATTGTQSI